MNDRPPANLSRLSRLKTALMAAAAVATRNLPAFQGAEGPAVPITNLMGKRGQAFRHVHPHHTYEHVSSPPELRRIVGRDGSVTYRQGVYISERGVFLHATKGYRDRLMKRRWSWL